MVHRLRMPQQFSKEGVWDRQLKRLQISHCSVIQNGMDNAS